MKTNIFQKYEKNWEKIFLCLLLFFAVGFFAKKINLVTADLGRHIKNGEIFFQTGKIIDTNFYSYTYPDFPTANHHWLSGLFFYLIWKVSDFGGLSFFYLILEILVIYLIFLTARLKSNFWISTLFCFLALPILGARAEVRPEIFSYFFTILFFYLLVKYEDKKLAKWIYFLFFICQIIWVNSHILWIFGPFLVGIYCVNYLIIVKDKKLFWDRIRLLILILIALLVNPFGIKSIIEPFLIFREYGYELAENQTIFFMQKKFGEIKYLYIELMALFWIGIVFLKKKKDNFNYLNLFLSLFFVIFGFWMIRNFIFFGIFFVIISSWDFFDLIKDSNRIALINKSINYLTIILAIIYLMNKNIFFGAFRNNFGLGLASDVLKSISFVKVKNIKGPILNNYDNGGFLIFGLNPTEKVFVDNRPEAYPVDFFENEYKKMTDEGVWKEMEKKYNFNLIYFYRHDMTPWGQEFMINRVKDRENWSPIYVDNYVIMFVKRNKNNRDLIEKYELPEEMFKVN